MLQESYHSVEVTDPWLYFVVGEDVDNIRLRIDGMTCGHCIGAVRKALAGVEGTTIQSVDVGSAVVAYDPIATELEKIDAAVEDAGYRVTKKTGDCF